MPGAGPTATALMRVARDRGELTVVADSICRAFVRGLGMDGAALSLLTGTVAGHVLHATDPVARLLEELQFELNEGVSIEAANTGRPVLVGDLLAGGDTDRWPFFTSALAERSPARAMFVWPLTWGSTRLGVLALYRARPGGLKDEQREDARTAADIAALMLLTARTDPAGVATPRRAEVHQATGMVLAQLGVDATVALARMRAYAFAEQRLLADVAHDVVARTLVFTQDPESGRDTEEAP